MPLTDRAIVNLKTTGKMHKHFDGGGLYIHVSPTGGKLWRLFYRFNGKTKLLSFGAYPAVTLKMARDRRDEAKAMLAKGVDPGEYKKELKKLTVALTENTFEAIAREWHVKFKDRWVTKHAKVVLSRMEKDIFPFIGNNERNEDSFPIPFFPSILRENIWPNIPVVMPTRPNRP